MLMIVVVNWINLIDFKQKTIHKKWIIIPIHLLCPLHKLLYHLQKFILTEELFVCLSCNAFQHLLHAWMMHCVAEEDVVLFLLDRKCFAYKSRKLLKHVCSYIHMCVKCMCTCTHHFIALFTSLVTLWVTLWRIFTGSLSFILGDPTVQSVHVTLHIWEWFTEVTWFLAGATPSSGFRLKGWSTRSHGRWGWCIIPCLYFTSCIHLW